MRSFIANALARLARMITPKGVPSALTGNQWSGTSYVDAYKRNRTPTPNELLAELKATAFTCASINAAVCANFPPRLYVSSEKDEPVAKWKKNHSTGQPSIASEATRTCRPVLPRPNSSKRS